MTPLQASTLPPLPSPIAVDPDSVWPEPVALPSKLLTVDPFDEVMLPTALRGWVADIADRMNCPLDFIAVPAMIAAASLIGRRVGIRPQVHTDWTEAANLWGAITGPPGTMKSPAVREAFAALRMLEKKAADAHDAAIQALKPRQQLFELQEREAKRAAGAALKGAEDPLMANLAALDILRELDEPDSPPQVRHVTNDVTPEKLGELCRDNPDGLLIHRDELLTMFQDLDREENASGRGFLMSGWGGLDGYTVDRIGRGTIRIPAVNLSLFGTTQPSRLLSYMRQSFKQQDDGLVQRLQLLVWPDFNGRWVNNDRPRNVVALEAAMSCYDRLATLHPDNVEAEITSSDGSGAIPFLRFSPAAQEQFDRWRATLEAKVLELETSDPYRGHLAKYRGLAPRLALVCHLASGGVGTVSLDAWVMAEMWIMYLTSHARRTYVALETDNTDVAHRIIRRLTKEELPRVFTSRDIYRNCWAGLKDREQVEQALQLLVEYDWLEAERVATGGKPKMTYTVNPKAMKKALH